MKLLLIIIFMILMYTTIYKSCKRDCYLKKYDKKVLIRDNINTLFSRKVRRYINDNNIHICNNELNFNVDCKVNEGYTSKHKLNTKKIYKYKMYFSYTALTRNCLYVLFDQNMIRSTSFVDNDKGNMIQQAVPGDLGVKIKSVIYEGIVNQEIYTLTPSILYNSDSIVKSIREYLNLKSLKIVLIYDFRAKLTTDTIYTDYNKYNEVLNYEVLINCKHNVYNTKELKSKRIKPKYKIEDKRIGHMINVIKRSNIHHFDFIDKSEISRVNDLLWSKDDHDLGLDLKFNDTYI